MNLENANETAERYQHHVGNYFYDNNQRKVVVVIKAYAGVKLSPNKDGASIDKYDVYFTVSSRDELKESTINLAYFNGNLVENPIT